MASILPHRDGYRVQVYVGGQRQSKVCATRREAAQWALEREVRTRAVSALQAAGIKAILPTLA